MELPADVRALFEAPNYAHLATLLPGGGPHSVPVWTGVEDGKIAFLTSPNSRKARNIAANPQVAVSVTDRVCAAGAAGRVPIPWSRREPHPLLAEWAQQHNLAGQGKRAIVPGCGLGANAEYLARLGFATTAFDISPTAIRLARHRHPDSP